YFKGLTLNLLNKTCTVDNIPVNLTKKELEILALLLDHKNKILSREEILHKVWSDDVIVLDRTIDVNITRLRKKIEPYGKYIVTRLGFGYGFQE
ncbi:MAG TPA: winged helix-turn-helix domain-containing protein, partial [Bacteroidales bacterium]|nr:winged helix-turn-helix domain-containing protein [Bacteroidales bacterium]